MNRKLFILIALLAGILILLTLALNSGSKKTSQPTTQIPVYSPVPSSQPASNEPVNTGYSIDGLDKNAQRIAAHTPLSPDDQAAFTKITASLDGNSNILVTAGNFQVKYVNPPNEFLVEVTSNNADQAKRDFQSWLKQAGFTDQGICHLPYVIYLSSEVKTYYQQNNLQFNPMPEGC